MKKWSIILVVVFLLIALGGSLLKKSGGDRCALDASRIEPIYEVDIIPNEGKALKFCCIECASKWLEANKGGYKYITVTDEATGERIDSSIANYVKSSIVTTLSTGNRIHVFADKASADKHAREFGGTVIDNPFALSPVTPHQH